ncbi:hypothetical protein ACP275_02G069300 [Erythranthe tilingii]
MELNLSPQMADTTIFEGEGGGYYTWTDAKSPALVEAELAAGKLVLQPRGFALPHYADSHKIGYVTQGTCTVGLVSPNNSEEKVVIINKGEAIPVSAGTISWWFNGGDFDVTLIFLGKGSQSYNPGQFNYFFLTGAIGLMGGFSTEFISKIYNFDESDLQKLAKSQVNPFIIKLGPEINMPSESNCTVGEYVFNFENEFFSNANTVEMTADNFTMLDKIGLSAGVVKLERNTIMSPSYSTDSAQRIFYVTKGSGRVQIVGLNGTQSLDAILEEGQIFVVPKFFAVTQLTGENGLEFFCVSTSPRPVLGQLGGIASVWKALSPPVLQAALSISPDFVRDFKSKIE